MKHPGEEQLVALYYGEMQRPETLMEHLRECAACRESFESLQRTLAALKELPVPERDANYGSQVWFRIAHRMDAPNQPTERQRSGWFGFRRLAAAGALTAAIVASFFAGRYWPRPATHIVTTDAAQIRQGVLLLAVSDHLDHAQMVLLELVNSDQNQPAHGGVSVPVNMQAEQARAQKLLVSNRLYEQTAQQTGDMEIENILNALEPVLLEIAHSPDEISSQQFQQIQDRIRNAGILFKVRVVSSDVHYKEQALARQKSQGQA
jgi:hypothetical protein